MTPIALYAEIQVTTVGNGTQNGTRFISDSSNLVEGLSIDTWRTLRTAIDGWVLLVVTVLGIAGNCIILHAMSEARTCCTREGTRRRIKDIRTPTTVLLCSLACADTCLLLVQLPHAMYVLFRDDLRYWLPARYYFRLRYVLSNTFMMASAWSLVMLCLVRLVAFWAPMKFKAIFTVQKAVMMAAAVYTFSIAFNASKFFEYRVNRNMTDPLTALPTQLRLNQMYVNFVRVGTMLITVLIPLSLLVVCNGLLLWRMARHLRSVKELQSIPKIRSQPRASTSLHRLSELPAPVSAARHLEQHLTLMALLIVNAFLFCHALRAYIYVVLLLDGTDDKFFSSYKNVMLDFSADVLVCLSSALNVLLVLFSGRPLRNLIKSACCCQPHETQGQSTLTYLSSNKHKRASEYSLRLSLPPVRDFRPDSNLKVQPERDERDSNDTSSQCRNSASREQCDPNEETAKCSYEQRKGSVVSFKLNAQPINRIQRKDSEERRIDSALLSMDRVIDDAASCASEDSVFYSNGSVNFGFRHDD